MSFDLRITFTGLCLFVPDPPRTCMHVVFPDTSGTTMAHRAMLTYDSAYDVQGATQLSRRLTCLSVERRRITLPDPSIYTGGAAPEDIDLALPDEVIDLGADAGAGTVSAALLQAGASPVNAEVVLAAGRVTDYRPAAMFTFASAAGPRRGPRPLANRVEWTLRDIPGSTFPLVNALDLDTRASTPLLSPLHALGRTIRLTISHLPAAELPGAQPPVPASPAALPAHFRTYYTLFGNGAAQQPVPVPVAAPNNWPYTGGCTNAAAAQPGNSTGTQNALGITVNCMVASGPIG